MIETDNNAAWADSDAPDVKVIYAQLLSDRSGRKEQKSGGNKSIEIK